MTKLVINSNYPNNLIAVGNSANDRNGDPLRTAFTKVNDAFDAIDANFTELYSAVGADVQIPSQATNGGKYLTTNGTTLSWATVNTEAPSALVNGANSATLDVVGSLAFTNGREIRTNIVDGIELYRSSDNTIGVYNGFARIKTFTTGGAKHIWEFDDVGILTLPNDSYLETTDVNLKVGSQGTVTIRSNAASNTTTRSWEFDKLGTITTPLMLPTSFTAVLDTAHMTQGVALTDTPWEFAVQFQVGPTGEVTTMMDQPFPNPVNPGYVSGYSFTFLEEDHGIPGYVFELTLNDVVLPGGAGWTANPAVSIAPDYPSTVASTGAIKLTADINSFIFGTNGKLQLPAGGDIVDSTGTSVLGGTGGASVTTSDTPPSGPAVGDLWYDTVGGRTYVYYDTTWIDANPLGAATLELQEVPSTNAGQAGDRKGMIAIDSAAGFFYYCVANYTDGLSIIWLRVSGTGAW